MYPSTLMGQCYFGRHVARRVCCVIVLVLSLIALRAGAVAPVAPYDAQAARQVAALESPEAGVRLRAAEALGFLRYYPAESALIELLQDDAPAVRRNAALALSSCGGRLSLLPLAACLDDPNWTVAQAAWVALTNLTGMEFPYDGLAALAQRREKAARWRHWIEALPEDDVPEAWRLLLASDDHGEVERAVRALGALGFTDFTGLVVTAIAPWKGVEDETAFAVKGRVQSGIRALGRLGGDAALDALEAFLFNAQWVPYAAEALGDSGGEQAAAMLMRAFPRYAQGMDRPGHTTYTHPHDRPHLDPSDRILYAPYAIAYALSRIPFDAPALLAELRAIALPIAAQIPLDVDGLMVYDEEPYQKIFRHLLERAGVRRDLAQVAFNALGEAPPLEPDALLYAGATMPDPWHGQMRARWAEQGAASPDSSFQATPVLRGGDAPLSMEVDVAGWEQLHLILDAVENYSMDRANWAEARLVAADGTVTYLDTLAPVSATQQHDRLRINESAAFEDLRIAGQHFDRGLHTHAVSHIQFELGGRYVTFMADVGVCASRASGQGSVRFLVSHTPIHRRSQDHPLDLGFHALWDQAAEAAETGVARRQIAWEQEDAAHIWMPDCVDARAMAGRYAEVAGGDFAEAAQALMERYEGEATLEAVRQLYYRSRNKDAVDQLLSHGAIAGNLLAALCRDVESVPVLLRLLEHDNHWVRINAAKTLIFMDARETADAIADRLRDSKPEAAYGYFDEVYFARAQGWDELNDPTPRYREALVVALGRLNAVAHVPLLVEMLFEERNALEIQYRAANALDMLATDEAMNALRQAERDHPYHSVRMVAREALWKHKIDALPRHERPEIKAPVVETTDIPDRSTRFVFIKGDHLPYNPFQMDSWRQAYMTTDSGPTYRPGRNLYVLHVAGDAPQVAPLTNFADGYVADCEVSYDGNTVLFSRREEDSPWWHIYEVQSDGSGLRAITHGPYHDVQPNVLPNGRIVFATSRLGMRDEYHGYLCTGLATMTPDGDDIQVVGFNFGRDAEPTVTADGKVLFTRLELFYSRMKTEWNLVSAFPDGVNMQTLYGPERRTFWSGIHGGYGAWTVSGDRHRQLRLTQPRPYRNDRHLLTTPAGPVITRGRFEETLLREAWLREGGNDPWVITTPYPLDDNTLLVAAGQKQQDFVADQFPADAVDLGLYLMSMDSGALTLLYNDPNTANFEARPLHPRTVPPVLAESSLAREGGFTGMLYADSVFITQLESVRERGRLLRVIEGQPQVARHATHTTGALEAWKNHGGAFARVLGTLPLAADGSFAVEVPADRLLHLQVLDSDRRVVGNQQVWMHVRPGERKGCIGCHEKPDTAAHSLRGHIAAFHSGDVPQALPDGREQLRYRAKIWFKGHLPDEREERQRTVQSVNLLGRN